MIWIFAANAATQTVVPSDGAASLQTRLDVLCLSGDASNRLIWGFEVSIEHPVTYDCDIPLTIEGSGVGVLVVTGTLAFDFDGPVTIDGLTLRGPIFGDGATVPPGQSPDDCFASQLQSYHRAVQSAGDLHLVDSTVRCLRGSGAIDATGPILNVQGSTFVDNEGPFDGVQSITAGPSTAVSISHSSFEGIDSAPSVVVEGAAEVRHSVFKSLLGEVGVTVGPNSSFRNNVVCDSFAPVAVRMAGPGVVSNSFFGNNFATALDLTGGTVFVEHSAFVGNGTGFTGASSVTASHNLFEANGAAFTGPTIPAFSLFFDNTVDGPSGEVGSDAIAADPLLDWTIATACDPVAYQPDPLSPLLDVGGPCDDYADTSVPPDGINDVALSGLCDVGPFGGEFAHLVQDTDADGVGSITDCDDLDPNVQQASPEVCDGLDNNCDGTVDEGVGETVFVDADGDGFGAGDSLVGCAGPLLATVDGDCDDSRSDVNPSAPELCDAVDHDCDGELDPETVDADSDGYPSEDCANPGAELDCDDSDPAVNPGSVELCTSPGDEDCDGVIDEVDSNTADALQAFADADGDGSGNSAEFMLVCDEVPDGFVTTEGDCDDDDATVADNCPTKNGCLCSSTSPSMGLSWSGILRRR